MYLYVAEFRVPASLWFYHNTVDMNTIHETFCSREERSTLLFIVTKCCSTRIVDVHLTIYTQDTFRLTTLAVSISAWARVVKYNKSLNRTRSIRPHSSSTEQLRGGVLYVRLYVSGTNRMANILQVFDKLDGFSAIHGQSARSSGSWTPVPFFQLWAECADRK